jgi:hypothetical protein
METSKTPVKPIKQAVVNIAGHDVLATLFEKNLIGASIRMICDLLGIDHRRQIRKMRANRATHDKIVLAIVDTAGGPQETNVIIAEAIPLWLNGIEPSRVKPEARETLEEFQRVAVQTLRAFFFPETREQQHSAPPKSEPEPAALPPPPQPPLSGLDYLHIGIDSIGQKEAEQDARLDRHEKRIAMIIEEVDRIGEQVTDLAETGPLSWEHQIELRTRLQALEHQTGQPTGVLKRELAATFDVPVIEQLPEARWGQIAEWFQQRLGW